MSSEIKNKCFLDKQVETKKVEIKQEPEEVKQEQNKVNYLMFFFFKNF